MKNFLTLFFLLLGLSLFAQEQAAWVYFKDKPNVQQALANPTTILTQAAIDRKNKHGVPIDKRDVPVNPTYISTVKTQTGIHVHAKSKWFNCVFVTGTKSNINTLKSLSFVDRIHFADENLNGQTSNRPEQVQREQKNFNIQVNFNYGNTTNQVEMLQTDYLHEQGYTGEGIRIAIIDTEFPNVDQMAAFERLRNHQNLLGGYDFVTNSTDIHTFSSSSHGTLVLSTISGYVQNKFVGTAPDASVYLFRTEDGSSEKPVEMAYWIEAAERADSLGVWVINTSLGYYSFDNAAYNYSKNDMDGQTTFITKGANVASEKGMLIVASAGNEGNTSWETITAPADSPKILTVGAVDAMGNYVSFSSRGPTADGRIKPDVVAQGKTAAVILPNGTISSANGTSFSAPITAGTVACLWGAFPNKTNMEIIQMVRQSASQYQQPDKYLGYGIPNFKVALNALSTTDFTNKENIALFPNPFSEELQLNFPGLEEKAQVTIYSLLGKVVYRQQIEAPKNTLQLQQLNKGLYLIEITSKEKQITYKIVKQ